MNSLFKGLSLLLVLTITACNTPPSLELEDYFAAQSRNHYLIFKPKQALWKISEASAPQDNEEVFLSLPFKNAQSQTALPLQDLLNMDLSSEPSVMVDPWLLNEEEREVYQSKVSFQRAIIMMKDGSLFIAQSSEGTEVSAYSFRDDFIEYGAKTIIPLPHRNRNMGWYRYGGASIEITSAFVGQDEADAYLIVSK
ncbi:MAG: hypothetical protein NWQ53_05060 [Flavobacteriales bacterium]|nr:hypothetical protein [Bacteroidota bacterium]MDP4587513.1 hypothetical protein [Flavobacteriales bacterium]MDP4952991.1 hypothetical protein [Flavobacteriales bacterium]